MSETPFNMSETDTLASLPRFRAYGLAADGVVQYLPGFRNVRTVKVGKDANGNPREMVTIGYAAGVTRTLDVIGREGVDAATLTADDFDAIERAVLDGVTVDGLDHATRSTALRSIAFPEIDLADIESFATHVGDGWNVASVAYVGLDHEGVTKGGVKFRRSDLSMVSPGGATYVWSTRASERKAGGITVATIVKPAAARSGFTA